MSAPLFRPGDESRPNVFSMPAGEDFLAHLARGLREALGERLGTALILLPTRRAVRELSEAFLQTAPDGQRAARLPLMRPLADIDPDTPPFEPGQLSAQITPAIDPALRKFMMSRLALEKEKRLRDIAPDPASAIALAEPLLSLLDDLQMEECDPLDGDVFDEIVGLSAEHYQEAASLYKIVRDVWPDYLASESRMDPMQRRVALLRALADLWEKEPPAHPVIIAGSTGTLPATAALIKTVSQLPQGLIVLPGLDAHISQDTVWAEIAADHPQYGLKRLIAHLGLSRGDIPPFPGVKSPLSRQARRRLVSEALIPANVTGDWLERIKTLAGETAKDNPFTTGRDGLTLVETETADEEAAVIALAMRRALEGAAKDAQTVALITPDPALGRRVRARLSRWNIHVDITAGDPLEETSAGLFLSLVLNCAFDPWSGVDLAALFSHPLTALSGKPGKARQAWQALEPHGFRGPRPASNAALSDRVSRAKGKGDDGLDALSRLHAILKPLTEAAAQNLLPAEFARLHLTAAEQIATSESRDGPARLWSGEDGEAAASAFTDILRHSDVLGRLNGPAYGRFLSQMFRGRVVRPLEYKSHPQLKILGPLEARLLSADIVIMGGLNEGVWPAPPKPDPMLSRGMREKLGLTLPERRYGLSAHDFAQAACAPRVMMTRCRRDGDGPTVASRWLWRLKTVLRGAWCPDADQNQAEDILAERLAPDLDYLALARAIDAVPADDVQSAEDPKPCPPVSARPRRLSVTKIETLIRDPYAIYARHILGLSALDPLDREVGPLEYGNAIHKALQLYFDEFTRTVPGRAPDWLAKECAQQLAARGYSEGQIFRIAPRLTALADWFVDWDKRCRAEGWRPVNIEQKGVMTLDLPGGKFELSGTPDRVDQRGKDLSLYDYKSGSGPSAGQVEAGFSPQLLLLAMMAESGALPGVENAPTENRAERLAYIRVGRVVPDKREDDIPSSRGTKTLRELIDEIKTGLPELLEKYDAPETVYRSQPRVQFRNIYGDYDHLARAAEWAGDGEDGS